jgi:osmotically inducible protein OsmC
MGIRVKRTADARWRGDVPNGAGHLSVQSGALDSSYSLKGRVEDPPETNPEELIGAAHAGCFAMSLANLLSEVGAPPDEISAHATVHLEQQDDGFSITTIVLEVTGTVSGIDDERFAALAHEAKETCPVSRALAGTTITLTARLGDAAT